jgi:hypothetical protein
MENNLDLWTRFLSEYIYEYTYIPAALGPASNRNDYQKHKSNNVSGD